MNAVRIANELSDRLDWINVSGVRMAAMRGRVVALVFWHAGSVSCENLLRDLRQIQGRHSDGLTVLAIHCPKFDAERDRDCVDTTIRRLGLKFPVASDPDFIAWQHYGIRGWPTTVLIDTKGQVQQQFAGDQCMDSLESGVERLLHEAGEDDSRVFETLQLANRLEPRLPMSFPSGLAVNDNHIYIADSGHHRVLECTHEGQILRQFGSGNPGLLDGISTDAGFQFPCGLALMKDSLYVADRGNHALRRIRLLDGEVDTVHGTGRAGPAINDRGELTPGTPMNAPNSVVGAFDRLYVAMAGTHQIWEYNRANKRFRVLAGSGAEGLADGVGHDARFAIPCALSLVQQTLYVADAGASALRSVHVTDGAVHTMVGKGLYEFGDQDGTRSSALFQQPLALALDTHSPMLWIADSYNNALKVLRLGGGDVITHDIEYKLHRPAALAASKGTIWIANTDAHELLHLDIESGSVRRVAVGE